MSRASCARVHPLRRCSRQERIRARIRLAASSLMAGLKPKKYFPVRALANRERNPYPRKRERGVLVGAAPGSVLAVDDAGLIGMQLQPRASRQPCSDRLAHL